MHSIALQKWCLIMCFVAAMLSVR